MADGNCTSIPSTVVQVSGPILLGSQMNWGLYGVLAVQLYIYHQAGFADSRKLKSIVYAVFLFETVQTVLITHDTFHELAISFGNYEGLLDPYYIWFDLPVQSAILSSVTQCFYAWRILILSNSRILAGLIVVLSLLQCAGGISEGIACLRYNSTSATLPIEAKSVAVWIGGSAACDITITVLMVYYLTRRRTGIRRTDTMVNKLIQLVIETGMATATLAIIQLSMYIAIKDSNYFMTPACVLPKAYSNSLMVLLNNRKSLRHDADSITLRATLPRPPGASQQVNHPIQVNIDQETFADSEGVMSSEFTVTKHTDDTLTKLSDRV